LECVRERTAGGRALIAVELSEFREPKSYGLSTNGGRRAVQSMRGEPA
jgi:hypothetical protein